MPASPSAAFELVQAQTVLEFTVIVLNAPAPPGTRSGLQHHWPQPPGLTRTACFGSNATGMKPAGRTAAAHTACLFVRGVVEDRVAAILPDLHSHPAVAGDRP